MIKWWHHILQPHCPDCRDEREESKICESCSILKHELEVVRLDNQRLLNRLLEVPKDEIKVNDSEFKPILPRNLPWAARKQMLEAEDRQRAKLMKQNQATPIITTEELEKELDVVEKERG
jgi:hypothetical protein